MAVDTKEVNLMNSLSTSDRLALLRVIAELQAQITALQATVADHEDRITDLEP
jgi:cell division protein FtsB